VLQTLEIKNYQSHKSTQIDFVPGVNVITGVSDSGKSAIFRALIWALKNRPSGETFKNWSAGESETVSVALEFDNNWFTKSRTNGKNKYETDKGFFEALRSDVPLPVQEIANITEYNIQTQFQPYFMLQDSPGERAKKLNELVGLDIIDRVFKRINTKLTATKNEIKSKTTALTETQTKMLQYTHLPSVEKKIASLRKDIEALAKVIGAASTVSEIVYKYQDSIKQTAEQSKILKAEPDFIKLTKQLNELGTYQANIGRLQTCVKNLTEATGMIADDKEWLQIEKPYNDLQELNKALFDLRGGCTSLSLQLKAVADTEDTMEYGMDELNKKILTYSNALQEAGTCPTCMSKVDKKTIANILIKLQGEE